MSYARSFTENDIGPADYLQWPFQSPQFEAETTHGVRIHHFVEHSIPYGGSESVNYFGVVEGRGTTHEGVPLKRVLHGPDFKNAELRVYFLAFERDSLPLKQKRHFYIPLRKDLFIELLEAAAVPPSFVDVLADNNGSFNAYSIDRSLHLFTKLPNTATTWCTLYFRHDVESAASTLLLVGSHTQRYQRRIEELYRGACDAQDRHHQRDPFAVVAAIVAEMSSLFEEERRVRDREVQVEEVKTGFAPMRFVPSQNPTSFTMGSTRSLHLAAGHLRFLQRAVEFQISFVEFLRMQHEISVAARKSTPHDSPHALAAALDASAARTRRSLDFTLSFTRGRLKQIVELSYRIVAQIKVVDNMIAQGDSHATVAIAEQSRRIAVDTKKDSVAMKTISALTMVFLPGTFVGTLFGMVFFSVTEDGRSGIRVSPIWWLYLAITIPLTALVLILWFGWLRWSMRSKIPHFEPSKVSDLVQASHHQEKDKGAFASHIERSEEAPVQVVVDDFSSVGDQHLY